VKKSLGSRSLFLALSCLFALVFFFFFWKYVPLAGRFQMALAPLLILTFAATAVRLESGLLLFCFLFPLINNLPYFFGIQENTPHAPTSLVLFLAFALGWLVHGAAKPSSPRSSLPVFRPVLLFAAIILVSGLVTFLRYANFFPFLTPAVRELVVNANGVRAGGAIMSAVFNCLNYLTGFLFFFILVNAVKSEALLRRIMTVMAGSFGVSLLFSLVQRFYSVKLGNTSFWVWLDRINATFKDPNSFGAYLAAFLPLLLALAFSSRGRLRVLWVALIVLSLFIFPSIGSRSGLIGVSVSVLAFFLLLWRTSEPAKRKKLALVPALAVLFFLAVFSFSMLSRDLVLFKRIGRSLNAAELFNRRLEYWGVASFMMGNYPLTGVGTGAFIVELPNYSRRLNLPTRFTDSAENYFFQAGAEFGFVGLLVAFWLFYEIIRRMLACWRQLPSREPPRFLLIGALAGMASLMVNLLFHTYIGSFEVHYLFWLLAATIFLFPKGEKTDGRSVLSSSFVVILTVAAVLFGLAHLWNSTRGLSLEKRTKEFSWDQNFGLYKRERDVRRFYFIWTRKSAGITVEKRGGTLVIPLLASHPDIEKNPVTVRISSSDPVFRSSKKLQEIVLRENRWVDFEQDLSSFSGDKIHLLFEAERTWQPLRHSGVPDPRYLGVALGDAWSMFPEDVPAEKTVGIERIAAQKWEGRFKEKLWSDGVSRLRFRTESGKSALRLHLKATRAYDIGPYLIVKIDDRLAGRTMLTKDGWTTLVFEPDIGAGEHVLSVQFANDIYNPDKSQDRNVLLGDLEVITLKP